MPIEKFSEMDNTSVAINSYEQVMKTSTLSLK